MDANIMIDAPEALVSWCKSYGGGVKLQRRGAAIIIGYLSNHGKMLSTNESGELYMNSSFSTEKTSLDEVVDRVCDWNYKELVDARQRKENPMDFLDYCRSSTQEKELEEHKFILDRLYKQTVYGLEVQAIAHNLAIEMIKEMHLVPAGDTKQMEETGVYGMVAEAGEEYGTDKKQEEKNDGFMLVGTDPAVASKGNELITEEHSEDTKEQGRIR